MKKYITLLPLLLFLAGCSDDDNKRLEPTYADIDWFALEDSSDEIDHMRYEIYAETGLSVYYNDTIGTQSRGYNGYGEEIIHTEVLTPCYSIGGGTNTLKYKLPQGRDNIRNGVVFIRDMVLPKLFPGAYPRSILLVDDLVLDAFSNTSIRAGDIYRGKMTTVVSRTKELGGMSAEERNALASEIAAYSLYVYLDLYHADKLANFYAVSDASVEWPEGSYHDTIYGQLVSTSSSSVPYRSHCNAFGFLETDPAMYSLFLAIGDEYLMFVNPSREYDVITFLKAVMSVSEADFRAAYEGRDGYGMLIDKYRLMREILETVKNNL